MDIITSEKIINLTKDVTDYELTDAVADFDKDSIPNHSLLRKWAFELFGKEDLGSIIMLAIPLALILSHRLRKRAYFLNQLQDVLKSDIALIENSLKNN